MREAVEHQLHTGARGIVFDLRDNGGGLVEEAQLIASIFIPERHDRHHARAHPAHGRRSLATGGAISSSIPVVVLVDSNTASASEIVTAALQDHRRATVVGTHTFGKGVFQQEEPLSNGGALDITVGEYFTPNGRNLGGGGVKQGAGVHPGSARGARRRHPARSGRGAEHARREGRSGDAREPPSQVTDRSSRCSQKRGRFWTAEPLFPAARAATASARAPGREAIALGAQLGRGAGAKARAGDIVLVADRPAGAVAAHRRAGIVRGDRPPRRGLAM